MLYRPGDKFKRLGITYTIESVVGSDVTINNGAGARMIVQSSWINPCWLIDLS